LNIMNKQKSASNRGFLSPDETWNEILRAKGGLYQRDFGFKSDFNVNSERLDPYAFIAGKLENIEMMNGMKYLKAKKWLWNEWEALSSYQKRLMGNNPQLLWNFFKDRIFRDSVKEDQANKIWMKASSN